MQKSKIMRECILIERERIAKRVAELGEEITRAMGAAGIADFDFLWLAEGAFVFAADLARKIDMPMRIMSLKVSSYGDALESGGRPEYSWDFSVHAGRHVLLVDDVLDSGLTARAIMGEIKKYGAAGARLCVLFEKLSSARAPEIRADFTGFQIGEEFIFGYGLDCARKFRNLPDVHKIIAEDARG